MIIWDQIEQISKPGCVVADSPNTAQSGRVPHSLLLWQVTLLMLFLLQDAFGKLKQM